MNEIEVPQVVISCIVILGLTLPCAIGMAQKAQKNVKEDKPAAGIIIGTVVLCLIMFFSFVGIITTLAEEDEQEPRNMTLVCNHYGDISHSLEIGPIRPSEISEAHLLRDLNCKLAITRPQ